MNTDIKHANTSKPAGIRETQNEQDNREYQNMMNTDKTASGTIAREFIQCADNNGKIGSFLATNANRQVSPTFNSLIDLYTWARSNGWKAEAGAYIKH